MSQDQQQQGETQRYLAISDAHERLIYAQISGDPAQISAAWDELKRAQEISSGPPSVEVIAKLILNDPAAALAAGLTTEEGTKHES